VTTPFEAGGEEKVRPGVNIIGAAEQVRLPWLVMASVASAREADVPHFRSKAHRNVCSAVDESRGADA
jgi:hypothetical protein